MDPASEFGLQKRYQAMLDIVISLLLVNRNSCCRLDPPLLDDEAEEDLGLVGQLLVVQHDDDGLEAAARQEHPHRHLETRGQVRAEVCQLDNINEIYR